VILADPRGAIRSPTASVRIRIKARIELVLSKLDH